MGFGLGLKVTAHDLDASLPALHTGGDTGGFFSLCENLWQAISSASDLSASAQEVAAGCLNG